MGFGSVKSLVSRSGELSPEPEDPHPIAPSVSIVGIVESYMELHEMAEKGKIPAWMNLLVVALCFPSKQPRQGYIRKSHVDGA